MEATVIAEEAKKVKLVPIRVRVVNPLEDSAWDENLGAFPGASVFHSAGWAAALHDAYGYEPLYFVAYRGDQFAGVLPLMEVRSLLTGTRGVSLPFTDFCPILALDDEVRAHLRTQALSLARARRWRTLELRHPDPLDPAADPIRQVSSPVSIRPSPPSWTGGDTCPTSRSSGSLELRGFANPSSSSSSDSDSISESNKLRFQVSDSNSSSLTHTLDLTPSLDDLFASFHPSHRRAIRKSEKANLKVEIDNTLQSLQDFYRLNCRTRRDHGLPPQPFGFFHALQARVLSLGNGLIVVAYHDKTPVSASVFLQFGTHALYKYGASDRRYQALRGNNRVMWEGIQACARSGATELSMGKTSARNAGLIRFKQGWGTMEQALDYERIDLASGESRIPDNHVFGWHNRLFQRLPLAANRTLGTLLYRHMG